MIRILKTVIFSCLLSLLFSCQEHKQQVQRKDAAYTLNLIDSLTETLGGPANRLVAYNRSVESTLKDKGMPGKNQVDSMNTYFSELIQTYDNAIRQITNDKTISKFKDLQNNFLQLLNKGREPWIVTVPVQIKLYRDGPGSLTVPEQKIYTNRQTYMLSSSSAVLDWAKIVADQETELERKYQLELINERYR